MSSYSDQIEISILLFFFFNLKPDIREQSSQSSISGHKKIVSQYECKEFCFADLTPLIKSQNNALTENLSFSEPY